MIKEQKPLTMAEAAELGGTEENQLKTFVKQFIKIDSKTAREIKEEIEKLGIIKLKEEHIVKIVDFMPEDVEDVLKILPGISLEQEEINKILEVIKKY